MVIMVIETLPLNSLYCTLLSIRISPQLLVQTHSPSIMVVEKVVLIAFKSAWLEAMLFETYGAT